MEGKPARLLVASPKIQNGARRAGKAAVAEGARPPLAKTPEPSRLTPELKGLIDRVVVPILVKGYVEKLENEKNARSRDPMTDARQTEAIQ
jgi:hypothetical protein